MYYYTHCLFIFFWHFLMWHVAGLTIDNFNLPNKGSSKGGKMFSSHTCAFDASLTLCLSRYVPIWSWFMMCSVLSTSWMIMAARKGGKLWTPEIGGQQWRTKQLGLQPLQPLRLHPFRPCHCLPNTSRGHQPARFRGAQGWRFRHGRGRNQCATTGGSLWNLGLKGGSCGKPRLP